MKKLPIVSPRLAYVVSDLRRVGPTNQTLNLIKYSPYRSSSLVITLFPEPADSMISEFNSAGITVLCLGLSRTAFALTGPHALTTALKSHCISLVHSYGVKPDGLCQKVCKKLSLPHVITLRNYPREDILSRMDPLRGRLALSHHLRTLRRAQHLVACSHSIQHKMQRDYPDLSIIVIQNGVDTDRYHPVSQAQKKKLRKKLSLPLDSPILISTSSFISRKRIPDSLQAFTRSFPEHKSDTKTLSPLFLLLGTGPELSSLEEKYSGKNLRFLGQRPNVLDYLQASDLFISTSSSEGLPNGVLEAISSGLPVLLSNIPEHLEILEEIPHFGTTFPLGDVSLLSRKLGTCLKLSNNSGKNHKIPENPLKNTPFTMESMSLSYVQHYASILHLPSFVL